MTDDDEPQFGPARGDGLYPYVVIESCFGRVHRRVEWASNLNAARALHGWTRQTHTTVQVRRATPADLPPT